MKRKPTATRAEIAKASTIEELQELARKYGYSIAWCNRIIEARLRKKRGY